jgi:type II secretory pathway component PulF
MPRTAVLLAAYWLVFMASLAFPLVAVFLVPAFEDVFRSFGPDLPLLTRALVEYRLALCAWPPITLAAAVFISVDGMSGRIHSAYKHGLWVLMAALLCSAFIVALAMYLPIIAMGS